MLIYLVYNLLTYKTDLNLNAAVILVFTSLFRLGELIYEANSPITNYT